jgi:hypothetical protein
MGTPPAMTTRNLHRIAVVVVWAVILGLAPYYIQNNDRLVIAEIMAAAILLFLAPVLTIALVLQEFDDRENGG